VIEYLSQKGLAYQEVDVGVDVVAREEMIRSTGSTSVPTIVIGNEVIIGFNRQRIDELTG